MNVEKKKIIEEIIDTAIENFAIGFEERHVKDVENPNGVINKKRNNIFMAELGKEFMFYSAFVRSFDSSFGKVLERLGNRIAKLSYEVRDTVGSFYSPQQSQHVESMISEYDKHSIPKIDDYSNFEGMSLTDTRSHEGTHATDHYFYNQKKKEHYLIELKAGGDLDNKKAKSEKSELLKEYFLLKNSLENKDEKIFLFFATAYNKNGEGNPWVQERVKQYFAIEELLIGKDYWNFVCDDEMGFEIIFSQYKKSAQHIKNSLENVKRIYFN